MEYLVDDKNPDFIRVGIGRNKNICIYSYNYVKELSTKYKYIIKAVKSFRIVDFDDEYCVYIFTNKEFPQQVIDFLNELNKFSGNYIHYINNINIMTLYSIKDKIEIL